MYYTTVVNPAAYLENLFTLPLSANLPDTNVRRTSKAYVSFLNPIKSPSCNARRGR